MSVVFVDFKSEYVIFSEIAIWTMIWTQIRKRNENKKMEKKMKQDIDFNPTLELIEENDVATSGACVACAGCSGGWLLALGIVLQNDPTPKPGERL